MFKYCEERDRYVKEPGRGKVPVYLGDYKCFTSPLQADCFYTFAHEIEEFEMMVAEVEVGTNAFPMTEIRDKLRNLYSRGKTLLDITCRRRSRIFGMLGLDIEGICENITSMIGESEEISMAEMLFQKCNNLYDLFDCGHLHYRLCDIQEQYDSAVSMHDEDEEESIREVFKVLGKCRLTLNIFAGYIHSIDISFLIGIVPVGIARIIHDYNQTYYMGGYDDMVNTILVYTYNCETLEEYEGYQRSLEEEVEHEHAYEDAIMAMDRDDPYYGQAMTAYYLDRDIY